ncbi:MAG: hypothetical protein RLY86_2093 [Pseudomonadota bacterium]
MPQDGSGGEQTSPWLSGIAVGKVRGGQRFGIGPLLTAESLKAELTEQLTQAGLLSRALNSRYILDATITRVDRPNRGKAETMEFTVAYTIRERQNGTIVFHGEHNTRQTRMGAIGTRSVSTLIGAGSDPWRVRSSPRIGSSTQQVALAQETRQAALETGVRRLIATLGKTAPVRRGRSCGSGCPNQMAALDI